MEPETLYIDPNPWRFVVSPTKGCCGQYEIHSFTYNLSGDPRYHPFPAGATRPVLNKLRNAFPEITSYHFTHFKRLAIELAQNLRNGGAVNVVEIPWNSMYKTETDLVTVFFEVRNPVKTPAKPSC